MNNIKYKYNQNIITVTFETNEDHSDIYMSENKGRAFLTSSDFYVCKNEPSEQSQEFSITLDSIGTSQKFTIDLDTTAWSTEDLLFLYIQDKDGSYYCFPMYNNQKLSNILMDKVKIKDLSDCCNVKCSDVNFFLAWYGLVLAQKTENYNSMVDFWKRLHDVRITNTSNCGCNG